MVVASTKTGLVLHTCPNIKSLLSVSAASKSLPAALHNEAVQYLDAPQVPYPVVRDLWVQLTPDYGVPFHQVLAGSSFVLESPKPREKVCTSISMSNFEIFTKISKTKPLNVWDFALVEVKLVPLDDYLKFCNVEILFRLLKLNTQNQY